MLMGEFVIINKDFRIEGTTHALNRMRERAIDQSVVMEVVIGLDAKVLLYNNSGEEIAIIDQEHNIAVIIEVRMDKVVIITVIDRANIHLKDGTRIEQIA